MGKHLGYSVKSAGVLITWEMRVYVRMRCIRLATWNMNTLTITIIELVDVMCRRTIKIACLQETKWRKNARKLGEQYYYIYRC